MRDTQKSESSNELRHVIQKWKSLRLQDAQKVKAMVSYQKKDLKKKIRAAGVRLREEGLKDDEVSYSLNNMFPTVDFITPR